MHSLHKLAHFTTNLTLKFLSPVRYNVLIDDYNVLIEQVFGYAFTSTLKKGRGLSMNVNEMIIEIYKQLDEQRRKELKSYLEKVSSHTEEPSCDPLQTTHQA